METNRKKSEKIRRLTVKKHRKEIIEELSKEYGLRCWYCGKKFEHNEKIAIDHIQAFSQQGKDTIDNFALACYICNSHKFYYPVENFVKYLAHIRSGEFSCPIITKLDKSILTEQEYDRLQKSFY